MPNPDYASTSSMNGIEAGVDADGAVLNYGTKVKTVAKTAAYTCTRSDSGTHFTNKGASGSVTFTLPAVATSTGCEYFFENCVLAQDLVVTAPAGTLVAYNNAAATSISLVTASNRAGNCIHVFCTGTKWVSGVRIQNIAVTITVA